MATGRTVTKHYRVYMGGYDLSGYGRTIGPIGMIADEADMTTWTDPVKGYYKNTGNVNIGDFNAVFDNTATTGLHAVMGSPGTYKDVIVAIGIQAAPAEGDPAFAGQFLYKTYQVTEDGGAVTASMSFAGWYSASTSLLYAPGWGRLLHANSAATAANTAVGFDSYQAASTSNGGVFAYQVTAGNGTATIKAQHASTNLDGSFSDITGATSGSLDCTSVQSGIAVTSTTLTINRYLRWQISLGTATSVTFVSAFIRA